MLYFLSTEVSAVEVQMLIGHLALPMVTLSGIKQPHFLHIFMSDKKLSQVLQ
jgi:hypothetical protein